MRKHSIKQDKINFDLKIGFGVSVLLAILGSFPRLVQFHKLNFIYFGISSLFSFTSCIIVWVIAQYFFSLVGECKWGKSITISMIISTILVFFDTKLWIDISEYLNPNILFEESFRFHLINISNNEWIGVLLLHSFFSAAAIHFIAGFIKLTQSRQKTNEELSLLKQENLETRLELLKQQISPHFLFNALSTLRSITTDNNSKNYITQLSNVYRYLLSKKDNKVRNLVPLQEELNFIHSYLYILNERFEDALQVEISINPALLVKRLPPLSIQILIENAVKHNIVSIDEPLHIMIENNDRNEIIVKNNLQPKTSSEESFGIGLENIKYRYKLLDDKTIDISMSDKEFRVTIPLI